MSEQVTQNSSGKLYRILSLAIVLLCFGIAFWAYPILPDKVPSHWNFAGEINGYSGRLNGAFLLPVIMLLLCVYTWLVPVIDPKRDNFKLMGKVYWLRYFFAVLFLGVLYFAKIIFALGLEKQNIVPVIAQVGVGLLTIVIGNYLPKVKYNYMFGIRTPWTLANEQVWRRTHRFMGPVFLLVGILAVFSGYFSVYGLRPILPLLISLPLISMVYSYVIFQNVNKV